MLTQALNYLFLCLGSCLWLAATLCMPPGMKTGLHLICLSATGQIAYILERGAIQLIAWESSSKSRLRQDTAELCPWAHCLIKGLSFFLCQPQTPRLPPCDDHVRVHMGGGDSVQGRAQPGCKLGGGDVCTWAFFDFLVLGWCCATQQGALEFSAKMCMLHCAGPGEPWASVKC